ncbi:hypothetical protein RhiirA5_410769 [Rhizophagus irregularis]|uniref:Uncharacterized protein n=1 Tax=Rhizophagus irregularis TaxID=588596 RepID=A0A2N0Q2Q6_9GLOM|nr:hypothetical protein RhiirA5_410769 [Rhizophagus irregularis]
MRFHRGAVEINEDPRKHYKFLPTDRDMLIIVLVNELVGLLGEEEQSLSKITKVSSAIEIIKETSDQTTSPIEIVSTTPGNFENVDNSTYIGSGSSLEETSESVSNFLQLSESIDNAETKNEDASQGLIYSYLDFGKSVYIRYKELKPSPD